jgi:hypothetical protein
VKDALVIIPVTVHNYELRTQATLDIDPNILHTDVIVDFNWLDAFGVRESLRDRVEKCSLDGGSFFAATILVHMHSLEILSVSGIKEHRRGHGNHLLGFSDVHLPLLARRELRDSI